MKAAGYVLFIIGVVLSALSAVPENINWLYFTLSAAVALTGGVLARKSMKGREAVRLSRGGEIKPESYFTLSLMGIKNNISEILYSSGNTGLKTEELKEGIETIQSAVLLFVENRESLGILYGAEAEADIITSFSAGERYLARSWSELVDGYTDAAFESLRASLENFTETLLLLKKCQY